MGCGTAYHACMIGEYYFNKFTNLDVSSELASELRYKNISNNNKTLYIFISQSGETMDTLMALKYIKKYKHRSVIITNSLQSSMVREADVTIPTYAQKEVGVASTKAFTGQVTVLSLMALSIAHKKGSISESKYRQLLVELDDIPNKVKEMLKSDKQVRHISNLFKDASNQNMACE